MTNAAQYKTCGEGPADQAAEFVPMINGVGQLKNGVSEPPACRRRCLLLTWVPLPR